MTEAARELVRNKIYKNSNIPLIYLKSDLGLKPESEDRPAFMRLKNIHDDCVRFVRQNWHLNLYSNNVGNGKTTWAIKIMKNFIDTYACNYDLDCIFINVPEFISLKKRSFSSPEAAAMFNQFEERILNARLVIFDEIASKQSSDFDEDLLYRLINHRTSNGKSTIYTSNVLPEELRKLVGERIADRITGTPNTANIELKGGSRRESY